MRNNYIVKSLMIPALLMWILILNSGQAMAHCDTMDGPVVKAAQRALEKKNVSLVLIWVQQKDEVEVRQRFSQTLVVRELSREARELADTYFFETVVRLHRAGEEEPYTGLKPAGTDPGSVISLADKALQDGSLEPLLRLFPQSAKEEIQARFKDVFSKRNFNENDVAAGREYVKAYVSLLHHLEHLHGKKTTE